MFSLVNYFFEHRLEHSPFFTQSQQSCFVPTDDERSSTFIKNYTSNMDNVKKRLKIVLKTYIFDNNAN